jgi:hypothetical protein
MNGDPWSGVELRHLRRWLRCCMPTASAAKTNPLPLERASHLGGEPHQPDGLGVRAARLVVDDADGALSGPPEAGRAAG